MRFTPEFTLTLDLCRTAFEPSARALELPKQLDWSRFLRLAHFHRVEGLVAAGLRQSSLDVPEDVHAVLAENGQRIAAESLRTAAESRRLLAAFEDSGLSPLFVKGLTLARLAYANTALKSAIDIDLLVGPEEIESAAATLFGLGYRCLIPKDASIRRVRRWHLRHKESQWLQADSGLLLDLHSRLADTPRLIPAIDAHSSRQLVEVVPGIALPTLAEEELFAYLCVHGAWSAWFRLKWITDLAAFALRSPEIGKLYRRSQELGAHRCAAQALLLADAFYGTLDKDEALRLELERSGANRRLLQSALRQVARPEPFEPTERRFGTLGIHLNELGVIPGIGFKLSEAKRQIVAALSR